MPVQKPTTKSASADTVYKMRQRKIGELTDLLLVKLAAHSAAQKANSANWGFPGDLDRVIHDLEDATKSLQPVKPTVEAAQVEAAEGR